ncbi:unnamed protein product [Parajaminaea phylloscopi]
MSNSRERPIVLTDSETDEEESSRVNKRIRILSRRAGDAEGAEASGGGTARTPPLEATRSDAPPYGPTSAPQQLTRSDSGQFGSLTREERAALEQQRRDRQKQRRRDAGVRSSSEPEECDAGNEVAVANGASLSTQAATPQARRPFQRMPGQPQEDQTAGASTWSVGATSGLGGSSKPALRRILADDRFWSGVVKRSYNRFTGDGVPFSDFFLPTTKNNTAGLMHAVIASYTYEWSWLETILPSAMVGQPGKPGPQFTFVTLEKPGVTEAGVYQLGTPGWVLLAIKSLGTMYSSMHIKMALLFYPNRLRLVVLTGNMQSSDWDLLENAAYIQDFPILSETAVHTTGDVYQQLDMILRGMDLPNSHYALRNLSRYNLAKGPTLVASIGSKTPVSDLDQIKRLGLGRLNEKVRELMGGAVGQGGLELEAQGSSMGTYSQRWLQQVHLLASGVPLSSCLPMPKADGAANRHYLQHIGADTADSWPPIKIVFPTDDFVRNRSILGVEGGGCHFGKPDRFQRWKHLCFQARSNRHGGILMHQKGLLGLNRGVEGNGDPSEVVGFALMSSANFTSAAWGNISQSPSGDLQMTSSNWELGVLFPLQRRDLEPQSELSTHARSSICWRRPPEPYGETDAPWTCQT